METEDNETKHSRVLLRERFLRFIARLSGNYLGDSISLKVMNIFYCLGGQPSRIVLHENVEIKGNLRAFDLDCQNIIVEKLETPYLPVERAIMRSSDIVSIHMKNVPCESFT